MSLVPPTAPSLMPGHRLDRYELLALIAEGGMGQVWLARLTGKRGFEKLVAVKTLLPKFAKDEKFQQMFLDEARIASGIEHANVAQILDLGEENDVLYLVMELVDGEALSKLTRVLSKAKQPFPLGVGLRIIADVCAGIHVAHELRGPDGQELGIVHRDISPQNILITTNGVSKLIDFGIAKARDRFSGETSEGILKGKIHYMAPEQALGRKMDRRADVFALGAILYLLFAGRPAYDGESQLEILHLLTSNTPPTPLPPKIPRAVNAVVMKALAPAPADRYQTALELQRAINKCMTECRFSADTSDVASFVGLHLAERTQKRRQAIDLALKAAADRAAMNATLLSPASNKSSPGTAVPFGALTPAPMSTSDVLSLPTAGLRSVSEVAAVAMQSAPMSPPDAPTTKRGRLARVALIGASVLALVIGTAVIATRVTQATDKNALQNAASSAPVTPTVTTTVTTKASPPSTTTTVASAPETAAVDASAQAVATPSAKPRATGRGSSAHTTNATATATATQRPPSNGAPDFGY